MTHSDWNSILSQHIALLGKTGAGKSYAMRGLIELLLNANKRVCIIDPKGDHWGVGSSADGKKAGFSVVTFGNHKVELKDNIPITAHVGKEVAELVATGNRPCVIAFRGWMPSDRTRFFIDFASTLFNKNDAPLWLAVDEVHNFAAQGKVLDPEAGKCLHWMNRIATEGRGIGIRLIMASQRPQKVHKDTLTCAETLVAMRVVHPLDRDAYKQWIDGCGDPERGKMVLNSVAGMKTGEAYVWSPEADIFEKLTFPKIKTFDSFRAPTGEGRENAPSGWAEVNLDEVRKKLAVTIEEAKQNDPKFLKRRIVELQSELLKKLPGKLPTLTAPANEETIRKAVDIAKREFDRVHHQEFMCVLNEMGVLAKTMVKVANEIDNALKKHDIFLSASELHYSQKTPVTDFVKKSTVSIKEDGETKRRTSELWPHVSATKQHTGLTPPEQRIADAIMWFNSIGISFPKQSAVSFLAGYRYTGSGFKNPRGSLKTKRFITYNGGGLALTPEGRELANAPDETPTNKELHKCVMSILPTPERRILQPLLDLYPRSMKQEEVAEIAGYKVTGSGFKNPRGRLKTLELIEYPSPGMLRAADILFID